MMLMFDEDESLISLLRHNREGSMTRCACVKFELMRDAPPPVGMSTNTSLPAKTASMTSLCCGRKQGLPNTRAFTKSSRSFCSSSAVIGSSTDRMAGLEAGIGGGGAPTCVNGYQHAFNTEVHTGTRSASPQLDGLDGTQHALSPRFTQAQGQPHPCLMDSTQ